MNDYFGLVLEAPPARTLDFNWEVLNLPHFDLNHLEESFTEKKLSEPFCKRPQIRPRAQMASREDSTSTVGESSKAT